MTQRNHLSTGYTGYPHTPNFERHASEAAKKLRDLAGFDLALSISAKIIQSISSENEAEYFHKLYASATSKAIQWLVEHIENHPESWQESALASYNEATTAQQG